MKILFDTTVFGQGLNARSADVRLLKDFISRVKAEVLVPRVVYEEAVNLLKKSLEDVNAKLEATQRLTGDGSRYRKFDISSEVLAHRRSLDDLLDFLGAKILPYPSVSHEELTMRALGPSKPFVAGGRGYRDALIWFTVLDTARNCEDKISFVSANSSDWCESKKEPRLHADLKQDMKNYGVDGSRLRLFSSLSEFNQEYAIATLPESVPVATGQKDPDYQQLLLDGEEWIKSLLDRQLPRFVADISGTHAFVEDMELLAISSPTDLRSSAARLMGTGRRLLQFSAEYRLSVEFTIQRADLAMWLQHLSFHQRRDVDEHRARVMSTLEARISFRLIQRGEETEAFSIDSITPPGTYDMTFTGLDPIAVRSDQVRVHAPQHETMGSVSCNSCGQRFFIGRHRLYPPAETYGHLVRKLESILADDHRSERAHANLYNLVGSYRAD